MGFQSPALGLVVTKRPYLRESLYVLHTFNYTYILYIDYNYLQSLHLWDLASVPSSCGPLDEADCCFLLELYPALRAEKFPHGNSKVNVESTSWAFLFSKIIAPLLQLTLVALHGLQLVLLHAWPNFLNRFI